MPGFIAGDERERLVAACDGILWFSTFEARRSFDTLPRQRVTSTFQSVGHSELSSSSLHLVSSALRSGRLIEPRHSLERV